MHLPHVCCTRSCSAPVPRILLDGLCVLISVELLQNWGKKKSGVLDNLGFAGMKTGIGWID